MMEWLNRLARRWQQLGPRTSALALQLLLWGLLAAFYVAWNSRPNYNFEGPLWPLILLEIGFAVVLFNSLVYFIIPRLLLQGRVWWALASGVAVVYAYRFWMYFGSVLAIAYAPLDPVMHRTLHGYYVEKFWDQLWLPLAFLASLMGMLAPMLFPLVISFVVYALVVDRRRLALERDHLRLERSYLKAQINPQFLFNTLGSLNAMTRTRDERAGDVVLHLADLMRYTLYETDTERVLLSRELEFLDDYLALERLRGAATTSITHQVIGAATTQQVAPLLLHPFLERLFAGSETAPAGTTFSSTIQVAPGQVTLTLQRFAPEQWPVPYATDPAIGAARRRLELQYPGQHTLQLSETDQQVRVLLTIELT